MKLVCKNILTANFPTRWVWAFYLLLAGLFFLQLPLHQSLPGNWDTWLYLYLFNYYPDYVSGLLTDADVYKPFFPDGRPPFMFGEPSFFNSLIYLPVQYIIGSPIWSYYLFICLVFSLNGTGVYLLSKKISGNSFIGFLGGLLFMFSNYLLCSIDQPNVLSVYPGLFSIYHLLVFHENKRPQNIFPVVFWGAVQVYCSGYHFLFWAVAVALLGLWKYKTYLNKEQISLLLKALVVLALLISPYVFLYLFSGLSATVVNPVTDDVLKDLSIHFRDFAQSHPYNILYGHRQDENLLYYIHALNPGVALTVLFLMGFFKSRHKKIFAVLVFVFAVLSVGPSCLDIPNPVYVFMKFVGLDQLMRTPVRAFMVVLAVACILSAQSLAFIFKKSFALGAVVFVLFAIENIPCRLQYYSSNDYITPPENLLDIISRMPEVEVLWMHPSLLYESGDVVGPGLGQVNREYIYMYWQTRFKKNMVNGMNGYVPFSNFRIRKGHNDIDSVMQEGKTYKIKHVYIDGMDYPGK